MIGHGFSGAPEQAELGSSLRTKIELCFRRDPIFHTGLNWTIRKGTKYANTAAGAQVLLQEEIPGLPGVDPELEDLGQAVVTHVLVCALGDVPPFVFKGMHNPELKNIVLLMDELKRSYGDISGADTVTCIGFARLV